MAQLKPDLEQVRLLLEAPCLDTESMWRRRMNRRGPQHSVGRNLHLSQDFHEAVADCKPKLAEVEVTW